MNLVASLLLIFVGVPAAPHSPSTGMFPQRPIAVEIGTSASQRGGLLDLLLAANDDDASAAELALSDYLDDRPWLRIVKREGEAAIAVSRTHRSISSQRRSKDGKQVSITYRYAVSAGIAIRGDRDSIEGETLVSRSYSSSAGRQTPTRTEDRDAFKKVGRELANKAREWLLARIAVIRPEGPGAGFQHRTRFKLLLKGDGLEVTEVVAGSPADSAGLKAGDRIRAIDGESGTVQMDERVRTWRLEPPGTRVTLEIERGGTRNSVSFELLDGVRPR